MLHEFWILTALDKLAIWEPALLDTTFPQSSIDQWITTTHLISVNVRNPNKSAPQVPHSRFQILVEICCLG
jgi:hypothetical protein